MDDTSCHSLSVQRVFDLAVRSGQSLRETEIEALQLGLVPARYKRNLGPIGLEGQIKLLKTKVAVIGLGGLGGTVIELLARFGVGRLAVADRDEFEDSNLNRQILCNVGNLGRPKAEEAKFRVNNINPAVEVKAYTARVSEHNLPEIIDGCQVVVDALDSIPTRFYLEKICKESAVPMVHGAIAGFLGQVMTIFPDDEGLVNVYGADEIGAPGLEVEIGTPCTTPFMVASLQVSEVLKIVLGWDDLLRNKLLMIDMKRMLVDRVDFTPFVERIVT